jgi:hypothetical protein
MDAATTGSQPYIFDKNMGEKLDEASLDLTRTNADGLPVVELIQEQKYVFDKDGWLLIPSVLADDDIEAMRAFCVRLATDPESIPEHERSPIGGPLQKLTDHPLVIGFMNEFVAYPALASQACYGFRHESAYLQYREFGSDNFGPHNGNGLMRFEGDSHIYRQIPGKAHAGLTRVVWELNPVEKTAAARCSLAGATRPPSPHQNPYRTAAHRSGRPTPAPPVRCSSSPRRSPTRATPGATRVKTGSASSVATTRSTPSGTNGSRTRNFWPPCHPNAGRSTGPSMRRTTLSVSRAEAEALGARSCRARSGAQLRAFPANRRIYHG